MEIEVDETRLQVNLDENEILPSGYHFPMDIFLNKTSIGHVPYVKSIYWGRALMEVSLRGDAISSRARFDLEVSKIDVLRIGSDYVELHFKGE